MSPGGQNCPQLRTSTRTYQQVPYYDRHCLLAGLTIGSNILSPCHLPQYKLKSLITPFLGLFWKIDLKKF